MRRAFLAIVLLSCVGACRALRDGPTEPVSFDSVQPALQRACVPCHGAERSESSVRLDSYYALLGCRADGRSLVELNDGTAPLLAVLDRADHAALLSTDERKLLVGWVDSKVPGPRSAVHGPDIMNPRAPGWHGQLASADQFAALRDPRADASCGRCHDGAPTRPQGVQHPAPNAPACSACHQRENGVLACATCHGDNDKSYPPRDACYFASAADAHRAHLEQHNFRATPLACDTCHPLPGAEVLSATHGNGKVELRFSALAGSDARYNEDGSCAVACHARGGEHAQPSWDTSLALDCNSCHLTPPPDHYPEPCSRCHAEMGSARDALSPAALHINGRVDVGSGTGTCGACHGDGQSPWPRDSLHRAHAETALTQPIECGTCHSVPNQLHSPSHLDGLVSVQLQGRAQRGDVQPSFDAASKTCSNVACHAGALRQTAAEPPRWSAMASANDRCTLCHGAPPAAPHVQQVNCGGGLCHGSQVSGAGREHGITQSGRTLHIDLTVQAGTP